MEGLKDKVFIVTGGGSGMGAATVQRLLAEGARVAAAGTNPDKLARIREQAVEAADRLLTVRFDLRDADSIASLVAQTTEHFGRLDGVANVAAAVSPDLSARDQGVDTMDPEVWVEMMRINVIGTGLVIRESLPALAAAGGGSIVNVSSLAAWQREEWLTAYSSSKIALHALTRHTAHVWGKKNIRVNAVAPGVVLTENVRTGTPPEILQGLLEKDRAAATRRARGPRQHDRLPAVGGVPLDHRPDPVGRRRSDHARVAPAGSPGQEPQPGRSVPSGSRFRGIR